jgi:MYXO-CTERM domain-containing protein
MDTPNEGEKPVDNMELFRQQASACGAGCACHSTASPGGLRWVLGILVLLVAATLASRR